MKKKKWFVITGPDDVGAEFASWAEAREYLRTLNQDARIIGPGCDPEEGDFPEYRYPVSLQTERDETRAEVERLRAEVERLRDVLNRIESMVWYEPDDEDDLVEAVRAHIRLLEGLLVEATRERDEARAEVERLRARVRSVDRSTAYEGKAFSNGESSQEDLAIVASERDAARAEVERLRAALAQAQRADE